MSFTDYLFLPLFLILLVPYFLAPKKMRWGILLAVSLLFYCTYGAELLPFALFAVLTAWAGGMGIQRRYDALAEELKSMPEASRSEKAARQAGARSDCRKIIWLCAALVLGVLVYTKTQRLLTEVPVLSGLTVFFSGLYRGLTAGLAKLPLLGLLVTESAAEAAEGVSFFVPLGISYYSMSLVGYLADVYWKKERAEKNPLRLALFALYFPKILEGPISKHRLLAAQLADTPDFDYLRLCHGLQRMLWGYLKKLCIADRLNLMVVPVFADYESYHGSVLLLAAIFGVFQLYCDFSGCMDMALGASEVLGIHMEENFDHPFASESAAEFWRRWHITLGVWFKDYIYMPLVISPRLLKLVGRVQKSAGKRAGRSVMTVLPLAAVWLLTGLWHGTGWNYILWGVYWGVLIILSNVFAPELKAFSARLHMDTDTPGIHGFRRARTFLLFTMGRIIVLPGSPEALGGVVHRLLFSFGVWSLGDGTLYACGLNQTNFWLAAGLILFLLYAERKQEQGVAWRQAIDRRHTAVRWAIYLGGIFFVLIFGIYGAGYDAGSFVYMNY